MNLTTKISVGIVDDHWTIHYGLIAFINSLSDFEVTLTATNGQILIQKFQSGLPHPQILIMDIRMAVMDGIATTEWLYKNHPEIKVIGLSASYPHNSKNMMLKNGCVGFLNKDDNCDTFRKALEDVANTGFMSDCSVTLIDAKQNNIKLKSRQQEFLVLICSNLTMEQISEKMNLSPKSIEGYNTRLHKLFGVHNRQALMNAAFDYGFVHRNMMESVE